MSQALVSHKVSLTTLSPVFIGAGEEHVLSPYSDFIQQGDSLVYIDTDKLQEAMQGDKALIDAYVKGMRQFENNRSTFSLEDFITGTLGSAVDDFVTRTVRIEGNIRKNHIRRFTATGGKPFIPGSSLKGAIRTAVLVDWLLNKPRGKKQLDQIRECVKKRDRKLLNSMNLDHLCFGNIANDAFRHLRISDSEVIDRSNISVGEMKRVSLSSGKKKHKQKQSSIPQWSEILDRSVETNISFSMIAPFAKTGFDFLNSQSVDELFSIVNRVYKKSCRRELKMLNGLSLFNDFSLFYKDLEQQITSLKSNEAIFRLGGGKTWFENSIGFSIDSEKFGPESLFEKYLDLLLDIKKIPFPSTRSAIVRHNVPVSPLGWVKLAVLD